MRAPARFLDPFMTLETPPVRPSTLSWRAMVCTALCTLLLLSACSTREPTQLSSTRGFLPDVMATRGFGLAEVVPSMPAFDPETWSYADPLHIQVDDGQGQDYLLRFVEPCRDLAYTRRIGHTTTDGRITPGDRVVTRISNRPLFCTIQEIRRLNRQSSD